MATHSDIFVEDPSESGLLDFAPRLFRLLGVESYETRDSSHYVDDTYFRSLGADVEVNVCYTDDSDFSTYRFWLHITSNALDRPAADLAHYYATILSANGFRCFVPTGNWGWADWEFAGRVYEA